ARDQVLSALSATTDSKNFDFSYSLFSTAATDAAPTTTSTMLCRKAPVVSNSPVPGATSSSRAVTTTCTVPPSTTIGPLVTGTGVINTNPTAMVASARIGRGLEVSVRVDATTVRESGFGDIGLAPMASSGYGGTSAVGSGGGQTLPGFAGLTEGTLGDREGAVAMMGMASPSGYLDLVQPAVGAATRTGTGSVDGVAVTVYRVSNDLNQLAGAPGTSGPEAQTITTALKLLKAQGYKADTVDVSIDGAGYIRRVKSVDSFADGSTVVLDATFSKFGCAGKVLMPGQTGATSPPSGCQSP
ncbi:MAG: hypothetical protein ACRD0E_07235, partial [Acidimicrobiales bacterium]